MSGVFVSVVMLVGATLQTAAACRAAANGRFLFGWFLIAADAVAACLESYLAAAAMVGFISLVKELAFMILLLVPEAAAAWRYPVFPFSAAAILGTLSLVSELAVFVIGATRSMGTTTLSKGSSYAAIAAASPRVDVEKTPHAAAAAASTDVLTSAGHVWTEFWGQPGPGHNFQRVEEEGRSGGGKLDSFFVFVVSLKGSSVQVRVEGSDSYESLAAKIAAKVNIPQCHWNLTFSEKICGMFHSLSPCFIATLPFGCARDSWVVLRSNPLLENGSVQHVIEEDAGLLAALASAAWHHDQLETPLRFSLNRGVAIKGNGVLWVENLSAVLINAPLNGGHLSNLQVPMLRMSGHPLQVAIEGSLSLLSMLLPFLNFSRV